MPSIPNSIYYLFSSLCERLGLEESVFLISLYGRPLAQRASYLALHSSLLGQMVAVYCDHNYCY